MSYFPFKQEMGAVSTKDDTSREAALREETPPNDLTKVIAEMKKQQKGQTNTLEVERSDVLHVAISYFKSHECEFRPLVVKMITEGVGENTRDLGGPLREFFTVFFKEILRKNIDMFEGHEQGRTLFPVYNERALSDNWFEAFGKAVVVSVMNGGPGFPYLAPCVVNFLRGREYESMLNIGLVYNTLLRQLIKRINNSETEEQLNGAIESDSERYIDHCGWPRYQMITMNNKLELTQTLLKWELIGKRIPALEQLKRGLDTFQFLSRTEKYQEADKLLMHMDSEKATAEYLKKSLRKEIDRLKLSCKEEENAKEYTLKCMDLMTDTEATSLFHFITGMSSLPVEDIPLEVEFNKLNKAAELPEAITCIQRLRIPLGNDSPMAFYSSFHKALAHGKYGFHGNDTLH
ncbi:uncharacterized protein LOC128212811 isoform X1 [Mya arenaria]|uniref:uncharacterized protein LOC128212811 isoform X1 n=1 Tax=Mya arenaria TaxID=6604 RepID=UPI0022E3A255|nr:uncharacterized protein LOC128212811 isoform X1 [Mya arenaria]